MPLYTSHELQGQCRNVITHFFDWLSYLAYLVLYGHALIPAEIDNLIHIFDYILIFVVVYNTRDNPLVTYNGTLKTPLPMRPAVLIDSGMPI